MMKATNIREAVERYEAIPETEKWLWERPNVMMSLKEGIEQVARGDVVEVELDLSDCWDVDFNEPDEDDEV